MVPRIERRSATSSRRSAIELAVQRPCLRAVVLPIGAPGDVPPCIRQRPFSIAGDRHDVPFRVLAPQRGLRCIGNLLCMGLLLGLLLARSPLYEDRGTALQKILHPGASFAIPSRIDRRSGEPRLVSRRLGQI